MKARCVPTFQSWGLQVYGPFLSLSLFVWDVPLCQHTLFKAVVLQPLKKSEVCFLFPKWLFFSLSLSLLLSLWFQWALPLLSLPPFSSRGVISTFLRLVRGPPSKGERDGRGAHWKLCLHVGMWWVYVIPRCSPPLIAVFFIDPV